MRKSRQPPVSVTCRACAKLFKVAVSKLNDYRRCKACRDAAKHYHTCGSKPSPTYRSWDSMKYRCSSVKAKDYRLYGGRGIKVCQRWQQFKNFLADMGERPIGTTLDRIDPDDDYCLQNCRWATPAQQTQNRKDLKLNFDQVKEIRQLYESEKLSFSTIGQRFNISAKYAQAIAVGRKWGNGM